MGYEDAVGSGAATPTTPGPEISMQTSEIEV
jgi:hypothetical protein